MEKREWLVFALSTILQIPSASHPKHNPDLYQQQKIAMEDFFAGICLLI